MLAIITVAAIYMSRQRYVSTDNAYLKTDRATVAAEVSGTVVAVRVAENERVAKGAPLVELDAQSRRIEVQRAQARLDEARTAISALGATLREKQSELAVARRDAQFANRELQRLQGLASRKLIAQTGLDTAERGAAAAEGRIEILVRDVEQIQAQLGTTTAPRARDTHPKIAAALAELAQARLDVERTVLHAPREGVVAKLPHVGDRLEVGKPALAIVADHDSWIEANFKETDLEFVRVGQPVRVKIDTYPNRRWTGRVQSIAQATGAEFAVIPAQNASANWIKVIQRIPVRIALEVAPDDPPLRAGMSVSVQVDTGRKVGLAQLFGREPT